MNEMVKTELAIISPDMFSLQVTPATIAGNFAEMKELVKATLEARKTLVTPETIQGGKTLAADFRKTAKALMAAWKEKKQLSMVDIDVADKEVKSICALLENGATEISEQVKQIEQETKDTCSKLLAAYRFECWESQNIDPEFRKLDIDDLVKLGSLTPKGELTKGARAEIEQRCQLNKAEQIKIESRLVSLEMACIKNGIEPPLSRASIESFLRTSNDEDFIRRLGFIIDAEVSRKTEAERLMREKLQKEQEAETQSKIEIALAKQEAEFRAEEERIAKEAAEKAKATKAVTETPAVETKENLKERYHNLIERNARYPDERNKAEIARLKALINDSPSEKVANVEAPAGSEYLQVRIYYNTSITYPFTTKPGADREKIKAFFKRRAVADGVLEESITGIEVLNGAG